MSIRIELRDLHKQFGEFTALRRFSETFHDGERIALLGHNGAGKSTLLNIMATLSRPTSGEMVYFHEGKPLKDKLKIREQLSYLGHQSMLYPDLTVLENVSFWARIQGADRSKDHLHFWLEKVGMADEGDRLFRECSRGMQQRISIARSLMTKPKLLLLDEPFSGLDMDGKHRLAQLLDDLVPSWLMVTHDWSLGYDLAERFWVLHRGRLIRSASKANLTQDELLALALGRKAAS